MDERQRVSRKQEKETAQKFGAIQHAGSGSGFRSHDMHTERLLIENKTVLQGNRQITLKADDLKRLTYAALIQGRIPILHVRLAGEDYVLLTEADFEEHLL